MELVIVIVISGILAGMLASFIVRPIESAVGMARTGELVDTADLALRRISRDVKAGLPNSVRIDNGEPAFEFVEVVAASSYRAGAGDDDLGTLHAGPDAVLNFSGADSAFNLLSPVADAAFANGTRMVVYNTSHHELYRQATSPSTPTVISPPAPAFGKGGSVGREQRVTVAGPGIRFASPSPRARIYFVRSPVSYACDGGQLLRFSDYGWYQNQPTIAQLRALATTQVLARNVDAAACRFLYAPGVGSRGALLGLDLTLRTPQGEQVRLLRQVHLENAP